MLFLCLRIEWTFEFDIILVKKNHDNSQLRSSSKRCKVITFFVQMKEHKEEEKMKQYVEDVKFTAQEDIVRM